MVLKAAELLQHEGADATSRAILQWITVLDDMGGRTVNLIAVGAVTFVILLSIRITLGKYRGVDWYALLHALISGIGSLMAAYLEVFAAETLTGTPEPLRSCQCQGPLTSLHRILPAITMGYATFDLMDGLTLGLDFALHGAGTLLVMVVFVATNAPQLVTPMLLMEVSTINLTMVRADFFPDIISLLNQLCFAIFFFLFRIIICPYLWFKLMLALHSEHSTEAYCFSPALYPLAGVMGLFFHSLNAFWFYKIVRKIKRKISGSEGITANNHLNELDKAEAERLKKQDTHKKKKGQ